MAHRTAEQLLRRRRIEAVIRLVAPALDTVLFVGDRVSRITGARQQLPPGRPRAQIER